VTFVTFVIFVTFVTFVASWLRGFVIVITAPA
jgi:hypothetical protein